MRAIVVYTVILNFLAVCAKIPEFISEIRNSTVVEGQDATLNCQIRNLGTYKMAWVKVETKTALTIHTQVITPDSRFRISHTNNENWVLHLRNVNSVDRGVYMCQINTIPMIKQTGYLQVHVPPDIIDDETSSDLVIKENQSIELRCQATGYPMPKISWIREDGQPIKVGNSSPEFNVSRNKLILRKATRKHSGAYFCLATNDVPPSVSKRIAVLIQFPPKVKVVNELVGAGVGTNVVLKCLVEAAPTPMTSWQQKSSAALIFSNNKISVTVIELDSYKFEMRAEIFNLSKQDYGIYTCHARNILGEGNGSIRLFETYSPKRHMWSQIPMSQQNDEKLSKEYDNSKPLIVKTDRRTPEVETLTENNSAQITIYVNWKQQFILLLFYSIKSLV